MIKRAEIIKPPSQKELFTIRAMILIGLICMFLFLSTLLDKSAIGYAPIYWMLISFIGFVCLRILIEWVHYLFITVPQTPARIKTYSVDIFTTYCAGEPYAMIQETLIAIQAISYPHTTYLCDEADDASLKELCQKLGVIHITRTIKKDAKAGNINNALQYATGELCVILDPDHTPFPEFLDSIADHFNDPEIGFVQIVQSYSNINDGLIAKGAAQQTFQFYGPIMMTMNKYGTVPAIGANCSFRRAALDSIGGHAAGLAEDMHTAMRLHAKGWKSVYIPAVLERGLVPNTLTAYYIQQLKWARGVFELLVTSYPKLFSKFSWQQKLHYGITPVFYLSGIFFLINFLIPIISLILDEIPLRMEVDSFFVAGFPIAISIILIRHYVQKWVMEEEERGFHVVGGLLMMGTWWVFILGFIYTIIRKTVPYIPTPKDENEKSNWILQMPNILLILCSMGAIVYGLENDWSPYTLIMSGFALFNCLILFFTIYAGAQNKLKARWKKTDTLSGLAKLYFYYKGVFWKTRRNAYAVIRNGKTILLIYAISVILYVLHYNRPFSKDIDLPVKFTERFDGLKELSVGGFVSTPPSKKIIDFLNGIKGITYRRGQNWTINFQELTMKELVTDFRNIKQTGFNTVKWYGPGIYDRNVLRIAESQELKLSYCFWMPDNLDFIQDKNSFDHYAKKVLKTIKELKGKEHIISWNIGNTVMQKFNLYYAKPELLYQQEAYIQWLRELVSDIKKLDPIRPVTIDIEADNTVIPITNILHAKIPQIDAFGLVLNDSSARIDQLNQLKVAWFFSKITANAYLQQPYKDRAIFMAGWRDEETKNYIRFDGLNDKFGRNKLALAQLKNYWKGINTTVEFPEIKILLPAVNISPSVALTYHAVIFQHNHWEILQEQNSIQCRWELVKTDVYGNPVSMKYLGDGSAISFQASDYPNNYRLCLYVSNGKAVDIILSKLNP